MSALPALAPAPPSPASSPLPLPEPSPPRRRWWILLVILLAAGAATAFWLNQRSQKTPAEAFATRTARAVVGTLERTLRLSGQTSSMDFANITVPMMRTRDNGSSMVLLFLAKSGAHVKKDELIAQIDAQSMQDHVDDLGETVAQAKADVKKRGAEQAIEWETLQQTLRVAKASFEKARYEAQASDVRSDIEQELLKLDVEETKARYEQEMTDLGPRKELNRAELRILEITRERHSRHHGRHLVDLTKFTIHAPMDGLAVIQSTFRGGEMGQIQQGDQVYTGQLVLKVVNPSRMQVEASANQAESSELRVGQPAKVYLDAFPGVPLSGKVYSIGALAVGGWRLNYYIRNIPVRVQIEGADPKLIPDLSASAEVVLEKAENALQIPLAAVKIEDSKPVVWVKQGDAFVKHPVKLGLRNETHVAALSGLAEGDEVRLN